MRSADKAKICHDAADIIRARGWFRTDEQGRTAIGNRDTGVCMVKATAIALSNDLKTRNDPELSRILAMCEIFDVPDINDAIKWNDTHTKRDVINRLNERRVYWEMKAFEELA